MKLTNHSIVKHHKFYWIYNTIKLALLLGIILYLSINKVNAQVKINYLNTPYVAYTYPENRILGVMLLEKDKCDTSNVLLTNIIYTQQDLIKTLDIKINTKDKLISNNETIITFKDKQITKLNSDINTYKKTTTRYKILSGVLFGTTISVSVLALILFL